MTISTINRESVFAACERAMAWHDWLRRLDRDPIDAEVDDADDAISLAYRTRPTCLRGVAALIATYLAIEDPDEHVRALLETIRDAVNILANR